MAMRYELVWADVGPEPIRGTHKRMEFVGNHGYLSLPRMHVHGIRLCEFGGVRTRMILISRRVADENGLDWQEQEAGA